MYYHPHDRAMAWLWNSEVGDLIELKAVSLHRTAVFEDTAAAFESNLASFAADRARRRAVAAAEQRRLTTDAYEQVFASGVSGSLSPERRRSAPRGELKRAKEATRKVAAREVFGAPKAAARRSVPADDGLQPGDARVDPRLLEGT